MMKKYWFLAMMAFCFTLGISPAVLAQTYAYGGVEIGSKGIKGALWELTRNKEYWDPTVFHTEKNNINIIASIAPGQNTFSKEGIAEATRAVALVLERMKEQATAKNLKNVNYFLVGSSGVATASNRDELKASVKDATGLSVDFITADEESEYGMLAVVPRKERAKTVLVDIGSGNTKIGYWNDQFARYVGTSIPYGSVTLKTKAKADVDGGTYQASLGKILDQSIRPEYAKVTQARPAFKNRQRIYWLGGAGWATNTFTHPGSLKTRYSILSRRDVDSFLGMLESDTWMDDNNFKKIPSSMRAKAFEEMKHVRDTFSKEDLLAGVGLMQTILKESNAKPVIVFPVRNSQWLYGYVLKKMVEQD